MDPSHASHEVSRQAPASAPCETTIRSQPPDVIVSVGSGEIMQEFECYKVMLSFSSGYLDTMLSSSMKEGTTSRIEFRDKVPEEWELFYEFIAPQKMGKSKHNAEINSDNVVILLPWFHEFQMQDYVEECDSYLTYNYISEVQTSFWEIERHSNESQLEHQARLEERKDKFDTIVNVLHLAHRYDLDSANVAMEEKVADLLSMSTHNHDLFDFPVVRSLLRLVLPLELDGETGLGTMSERDSLHLWPLFKTIILPHTSSLTQDIISDNVHFPHLFYCYLQNKLLKDKARAREERAQEEITDLKAKNRKAKKLHNSAVDIIDTFIQVLPVDLYEALPEGVSIGNFSVEGETIDVVARDALRRIIYNYYEHDHGVDFENLGITLPAKYNELLSMKEALDSMTHTRSSHFTVLD